MGISAGVSASFQIFNSASSTGFNVDSYSGITGPSSFGTGGFHSTQIYTGDTFRLAIGMVGVPSGYVSGSALNATTTFSNATFASLGLTVGTYVFSAPHDTITVNIETPAAAALPEPATWAMMLLGFGGIGFAVRRKRSTETLAQVA